MSTRSAVLHVAALPFPSHQGTQAAIAQMLEALALDGRRHELLCYAHAGYEAIFPFTVNRALERLPYRSLRSGPAAHKILANACLRRAFSHCRERLLPELVVAHHVEAAMLTSRARRQLYFAHTDLGAELPAYAAAMPKALLAAAGGQIDRALVQRASAVAAISPRLTQRLASLARTDNVFYVPPPWPLLEPIAAAERVAGREQLGVHDNGSRATVLLYAGNLDRYQGWEEVLGAVSMLAPGLPGLKLVVGTQSDAAPLWRAAREMGVGERLSVRAIDSEAGRRALYAAADVAVVPRRHTGGLPIKLLDAMARGIPCVVTPTATAGLVLDGAALVTARDDAHALAAGIRQLIASPEHAASLATNARRYIATRHSAEAFLRAFDVALARIAQA